MTLYKVLDILSDNPYYNVSRGSTYFATTSSNIGLWRRAATLTIL